MISRSEPLIGSKGKAILPDSCITASTCPANKTPYIAGMGRIRMGEKYAWRADKDDKDPWVQFDFQETANVMEIHTQGWPLENRWVTKYKIQYSPDGESWTQFPHEFEGNTDSTSIQKQVLEMPISCRLLKVMPTQWSDIPAGRSFSFPSMHIEVLGNLADNPMIDKVNEAVDQLFGLFVGLLVGAPTDLVTKQVRQLVPLLADYAEWVIRHDDSLKNSAGALISIMRDLSMYKTSRGKMEFDVFTPIQDAGVNKGQVPLVVILEALIDMFLPFLNQDAKEPLAAMVRAGVDLKTCGDDPSKLKTSQGDIVKNLAAALGKPNYAVGGVLALATGDWQGAVEFCMSFCSLDPNVLDQMAKLIPMVNQTMAGTSEAIESKTMYTKDETMRFKRIIGDAQNAKSSSRDLFDVVDLDRSKCISVDEFKVLMVRLGFNLGEHKLKEIFSKSKFSTSNNGASNQSEGLNAEEFQRAVQYMHSTVAFSAL